MALDSRPAFRLPCSPHGCAHKNGRDHRGARRALPGPPPHLRRREALLRARRGRAPRRSLRRVPDHRQHRRPPRWPRDRRRAHRGALRLRGAGGRLLRLRPLPARRRDRRQRQHAGDGRGVPPGPAGDLRHAGDDVLLGALQGPDAHHRRRRPGGGGALPRERLQAGLPALLPRANRAPRAAGDARHRRAQRSLLGVRRQAPVPALPPELRAPVPPEGRVRPAPRRARHLGLRDHRGPGRRLGERRAPLGLPRAFRRRRGRARHPPAAAPAPRPPAHAARGVPLRRELLHAHAQRTQRPAASLSRAARRAGRPRARAGRRRRRGAGRDAQPRAHDRPRSDDRRRRWAHHRPEQQRLRLAVADSGTIATTCRSRCGRRRRPRRRRGGRRSSSRRPAAPRPRARRARLPRSARGRWRPSSARRRALPRDPRVTTGAGPPDPRHLRLPRRARSRRSPCARWVRARSSASWR